MVTAKQRNTLESSLELGLGGYGNNGDNPRKFPTFHICDYSSDHHKIVKEFSIENFVVKFREKEPESIEDKLSKEFN